MRRGKESAFEEFFAELFPVVYRYCLSRADGDQDLAEEVTQVTLTKAVRNIGSFKGEASLLTWTISIARRCLLDEWQKAKRRKIVESFDAGDSTLDAILASLSLDTDALPTDELRSLRQQIRAAMDRVHPRQRRALEARYLRDQSVREVAALLRVSEKAAESLLSRGRAAFKEAFLLLEAGGWAGTNGGDRSSSTGTHRVERSGAMRSSS